MSEREHDESADLRALAWVADELRRTLENVHKNLRRALPGVAGSAADPAGLQQARVQLHQGAGALVMVGQPEAARLLEAAEQVVVRLAQDPHAPALAAVQVIERASFALLDLLRHRLAGRPTSPVALFPQYRELQALAGVDRVHPADLWPSQSRGAPGAAVSALPPSVPPLEPDAKARGRMEQLMLSLLRGPVEPAAAQMSQLFDGLAAGAQQHHHDRLAELWQVASAFFEAQARGRLQADVYSKRLSSRLLAQLRLVEKGQTEVSDRLTQDLLFFCAQARGAGDSPRLEAVRRGFGLDGAAGVDYEHETLGRYDPALIPLARRRVEALKESWAAATAGQPGLAASLREQATLVADSVRKLHADGDAMARALDAAVTQVADGAAVPTPGLAMEVATSLLCLDAVLDDADVADASFGPRMVQLAERIDLARQGRSPGPIEPWMEQLYHRASDRQTMGSVVHELRASLADVEQQIDRFNRHPEDREPLIPVPARLSAMRGVLSVLGLEHAGQAVMRMRDEVDGLLAGDSGGRTPDESVARLAANVGALGFLIDLLGVQPQLAKSLFRFDPEAGRLETLQGRTAVPNPSSPAAPSTEAPLLEQVQSVAQVAGDEGSSKAEVMRQLESLSQQAVVSDETSLAEAAKAARSALAQVEDHGDAAAVRQEVAQALSGFAAPPPATPVAAPVAVSASATAQDPEMLEVFFEEAAEVIAAAHESLSRLAEEPQHFESMSIVRRAFHTLKGSSRMVGLKDYGEAAWSCEQLYNARLAEPVVEADPTLIAFSRGALDHLDRWVQALSAGQATGFHSAPVVQAALALRDGVAPPPAAAPAPAPLPETVPVPTLEAVPTPLPVPTLEAVPTPLPTPTPTPGASPTPVAGAEEAPWPPMSELPSEGVDGTGVLAELPSDTVIPHEEVRDTESMGLQEFQTTWAGSLDGAELGGLPEELLRLDLSLDDLPAEPQALSPSADAGGGVLDFELDLAALDEPPSDIDAPSGAVLDDGPPASAPATAPDRPALPVDGASLDLQRTGPAANDAGMASELPEPPDDAENYKVIGPLRIGLGLFNIFLNEADEQSRRLCTSIAEWALELPRSVDDDAVALAHSLAGNSATVGHAELSALARRLEHALEGSGARGVDADEVAVYGEVADEIRRLLHQFAAGFLQSPVPAVLARFDALEERLRAHGAPHETALPTPEVVEWSAEPERGPHEPDVLPDELGAVAAELSWPEVPDATELIAAPEGVEFPEGEALSTLVPPAQHPPEVEEPSPTDAPPLELAQLYAEVPLPEVPAHPTDRPTEPAPGAAPTPLAEPLPILEPSVVQGAEALLHEPVPLQEPVASGEPTTGSQAPAADLSAAASPQGMASGILPESGLGSVRFSVLDEVLRSDGPAAVAVEEVDHELPAFARDLDVRDAIDPELFEIFSEEAQELLPTLAAHVRAWEGAPGQQAEAFGAMRALHTLKGSARLAGAMRLGELAHRLESAVEQRVGGHAANPPTMEALHAGVDVLSEEFQRLQQMAQQQAAEAAEAAAPASAAPAEKPAEDIPVAGVTDSWPLAKPAAPSTPTPGASPVEAASSAAPAASAERAESSEHRLDADSVEPAGPAEPAVPAGQAGSAMPAVAGGPEAPAAIDWGRFAASRPGQVLRASEAGAAQAAAPFVRVRAPLLDRLVNQAGEVSITRSRLETDVTQMRSSLRELTENLDRLRHQLRDIELQADSQIASRLEQSRSAAVEFDPLEMDRFTRFQELTRMMAESVNDVATVQRSLQQSVQEAEDEMAAQARLTRSLQEDLLRARMVPFDALSERLYRVVRQAAKETGTQVRLNIEGSTIELDRSVLDRIAAALEHLLRNAVVHGIEPPEVRRLQDKDPVGTIDIVLVQHGNEVRLDIRDDGSGLDLPRIEARARALGLVTADASPSDAELANLIFTPGFSTAERVTELAGRGIGMDVVRSDVTALGGRIETAAAPGRGTSFRLLLPLTTAVTRVVQLRCGDLTVAMPASLVEVVRRAPKADVEQAYRSQHFREGSEDVPFFWLGALLQSTAHGQLTGRTAQIVLVRSAQQRVALHVDQVVGNQEVVVKNLGPQLARLPGLAGMSLLASGEIVPIYNPVALAAVYGRQASVAVAEAEAEAAVAAQVPPQAVVEAQAETRVPLVLVVDDSLTVRRVTQRLLAREGFRVAVAKDGLDALEQLEVERPAVMLSDIEMPRMDGFDLLRNVRHDARWQALPVIMITSRIAQKHRDMAVQLGADHYLGKPYDEEELISLVRELSTRAQPA